MGAVLFLGACSSSEDSKNDSAPNAAAAPTAAAAAPTFGQVAPSPAGTGQAGTGSGTSGTKAPAAAPSGAPAANNPPVQDRKLVLTADVRLEADDPEAVAANARSITIGMGGFVAGEQTTRSARNVTTSSLTLKVPPAQFDKALDQLSALGTVIGRNRTATDITEQVVDVESRIETQRRSVERVRELLAKATSLSEIVSIEAEVTRREADLESLMKRQQTLTAQSDLATIALAVNARPEPAPKVDPPKPPEPVKEDKGGESFGGAVVDALGGGWHAFYVTVRGILVVLAAVLPFLVVFLVLLWLLHQYRAPIKQAIAARRTAQEEPFVRWEERRRGRATGGTARDHDDEHEYEPAATPTSAPQRPSAPPSSPPANTPSDPPGDRPDAP